MEDQLRRVLEQQALDWKVEANHLREDAKKLLVRADQLEECSIKLSLRIEQNPPPSPKQSSPSPSSL